MVNNYFLILTAVSIEYYFPNIFAVFVILVENEKAQNYKTV